MRKKSILFFGVIIIVFCIVALLNGRKYPQVKKAISPKLAEKKYREEQDSLIVNSNFWTTGTGWIIAEGEDKGQSIRLLDFEADLKLSGDILRVETNKFWVKGELRNPSSEDEKYGTKYEMIVHSWEIIAPIKREPIIEGDPRWFPPRGYLDESDFIVSPMTIGERE